MSHGSFRDKHGLSVELLADTDGEVCRSYGVLHEKEMEGKRKTGILRSTFVIDRNGVVRHALYGVSPRGHAAEVLNLLKGMPELQIGKNTVVSLTYQLSGSDGNLIEQPTSPSATCTAATTAFSRSWSRRWRASRRATPAKCVWQPDDAFGNTKQSWCGSSRAGCSRPT